MESDIAVIECRYKTGWGLSDWEVLAYIGPDRSPSEDLDFKGAVKMRIRYLQPTS